MIFVVFCRIMQYSYEKTAIHFSARMCYYISKANDVIEPPICFAVRFSTFGAFAVDIIHAPNAIYRF